MKKIYFLIAGFLISISIFSQVPLKEFSAAGYTVSGVETKGITALGDTLFFENFNNTSSWGFEHFGNTTTGWTIGTESDPSTTQLIGYMGNMYLWNNAPYPENKFASFNAVQYLVAPPNPFPKNINEAITSGTINLSGHYNIGIQWSQNYRAFNYDKLYLECSNDGGVTWQTAEGTELFASVNGNTWAPIVKQVNITNYVSNSSNVKIRFRWECNCTASSNSSCAGYGWMIDDVLIFEYPFNDLTIDNIMPSFTVAGYGYYSKMPLKQKQSIKKTITRIKNIGGNDQSDINYSLQIFSGDNVVPDYENNTATPHPVCATGTKDSNIVDLVFTPDAMIKPYRIVGTISQAEPDYDYRDNSDTVPFAVTDSVFARDRKFSGMISPTTAWQDGDNISVMYYLPYDDTVKSVSVFIHPLSNVGATIKGVIYNVSGVYNEQITTNNHVITLEDLGKWVTLSFRPNYNGSNELLYGGSRYFAAIRFNWGSPSFAMAPSIGSDINPPTTNAEKKNSAKFIRGTSGSSLIDFNYSMPMIRLNLSASCRLKLNATVVNATTSTSTDGSISLIATGAVSPVSYSWENGSTSDVRNNLAYGQYTVTVVDSIGCSVEKSYIIQAPCGIQISGAITHPTGSQNNGSIILSVNNAIPPYTAQWSNSSSALNQYNLAPGSYTVTVTDQGGCSGTASWLLEATEVQKIESNIDVSLFPNPVKNIINIKGGDISTLRLYDLLGKNIFNSDVVNGFVKIPELHNGMYIVKLHGKSGNFTRVIQVIKN